MLAIAVSVGAARTRRDVLVGIRLELADHRRIQRAAGQPRVVAAARGGVDLRCPPARDARIAKSKARSGCCAATVRDHARAVGLARLVGQRQFQRALRQRLVLRRSTAASSSSSFTSGVFSACAAACSLSHVAASACARRRRGSCLRSAAGIAAGSVALRRVTAARFGDHRLRRPARRACRSAACAGSRPDRPRPASRSQPTRANTGASVAIANVRKRRLALRHRPR